MTVALITGSGGLVGSESAAYFAALGMDIVGVDNDMRSFFFGDEASTEWSVKELERTLGSRYEHHDLDIRDRDSIMALFRRLGKSLRLVIHTAAQPSHDWAARDPVTDFDVNM